jgi:hypothetical protein
MERQMTAEMGEDDYQELKKFLDFYAGRYMGVERLPPDLRPMACLEALERKSLKKASRGLRQAIGDILERTRHMDLRKIEGIDSELRSHNIVTLSALRQRFSTDYAKVIKREELSDETEYYFFRGILNDLSSKLPKQEKDLIARMVAEFEERAVRIPLDDTGEG